MVDLDGKWIREALKDGDRVAIMIDNTVFHTSFREGFPKPYLQPLPWDNWETLTRKPAAYCAHETPTSTQEPKKQIDNKKSGLILILAGAVLCLVLGAIFCIFPNVDFFDAVIGMYAYFGLSATFAGLLSIASPTMCEKGYTVGFGVALHYGTALLGGKVLPALGCEDPSGSLIIAFVIAALICYIVWEKHFKHT